MGIVVALGAYLIMGVTGVYLAGLVIGVVLLDVGQQVTHISNQSRIFSLLPEARSRLNTVYMTSSFIGGSVGSLAGGFAWAHWQWPGVCTMGLLFVVAAFLINRFYGRGGQ
jgi:predicted MFS family arabinose efflux permease